MGATCTESTCTTSGSIPCDYTDRAGVGCGTAWCEEHIRLFGGKNYCRRHASTVAALARLPAANGAPPPLPPVKNRGASLLRWMLKDLDSPIQELIQRRRPTAGELQSSGCTVGDGSALSTWIWRWHADGGRSELIISMSVEEQADDLVSMYVNDELVYREKPPWIRHHQNGEQVDRTTDAWERREYEKAIIESISAAL